MKKIFLIAVSMLALSSGVALSAEQTATGEAKAKILRPTTIEATQEMQFGNMLKGEHTVEITTTGERKGQANYLIGGVTPKEGVFEIDAPEKQNFTVSTPDEIVVENGDSSMVIDKVKAKLDGAEGDAEGGTDFNGATDDSGKATLRVGGTLNVTNQAAEGDYSGTYDVTIKY